MSSFTDTELTRMSKSLKSNPATIKRWERTLGLQGMTTKGAVAAIREAKLNGQRPDPPTPDWVDRY